jgi:hypothetical protein
MGAMGFPPFVTDADGRVCTTKLRSRDAVARGSLSWSAPQLGIGGTGASFGEAGLTESRDRCQSAAPRRGNR